MRIKGCSILIILDTLQAMRMIQPIFATHETQFLIVGATTPPAEPVSPLHPPVPHSPPTPPTRPSTTHATPSTSLPLYHLWLGRGMMRIAAILGILVISLAIFSGPRTMSRRG